eukprot:CAMPEP_0206280640 /NCGR_PEP_ID=MMETSP0047_2-20121206/38689_1 /ASSEMBLY_ACC=CAM_ASM_000192 /TAXON_ID=195065 /ORGANISM="Chroomonas mesostigmatica_cf, Strain CCMP1168" /LENGTH=104 /DNA_ID=CAMNT_0053710721 /DNA_START=462 /DNA_END=777 /DNA_ORIENTATION=+
MSASVAATLDAGLPDLSSAYEAPPCSPPAPTSAPLAVRAPVLCNRGPERHADARSQKFPCLECTRPMPKMGPAVCGCEGARIFLWMPSASLKALSAFESLPSSK